jgi:hypothetical protein
MPATDSERKVQRANCQFTVYIALTFDDNNALNLGRTTSRVESLEGRRWARKGASSMVQRHEAGVTITRLFVALLDAFLHGRRSPREARGLAERCWLVNKWEGQAQ